MNVTMQCVMGGLVGLEACVVILALAPHNSLGPHRSFMSDLAIVLHTSGTAADSSFATPPFLGVALPVFFTLVIGGCIVLWFWAQQAVVRRSCPPAGVQIVILPGGFCASLRHDGPHG